MNEETEDSLDVTQLKNMNGTDGILDVIWQEIWMDHVTV